MRFVHIAFAVISTLRMIELFLMDRITLKLRQKFPSYLWQCSRCLSVWAGTAATVMFLVYPWLNWPFALSWLYFVHNDWVVARRAAKEGRKFVLAIKQPGQWAMERNEFTNEEVVEIFQKLTTPQPVNGAERQAN
jgi:hypothetical protein